MGGVNRLGGMIGWPWRKRRYVCDKKIYIPSFYKVMKNHKSPSYKGVPLGPFHKLVDFSLNVLL